MSEPGLQGLRPWVIQRISAVYLAFLFLYLLVSLLAQPASAHSYVAWRQWLGQPGNSVALGIGFLALLLHAWVGVRDVVLDYVHHMALRLTILTAVSVLLLGCGFRAFTLIALVRNAG